MPRTKPTNRTTRKRASTTNAVNQKIEQEARTIVGREIQRDINLSVNQAIAAVVQHFERARQVEDIMAKGEGDPVAYALGGLLVELSNEAQVGQRHPRIAGVFYRVALDEAQRVINPGWALQTCMRHLAILLNNPTVKTARKISDYWDHSDGDVNTDQERDPFPGATRRRKAVQRD